MFEEGFGLVIVEGMLFYLWGACNHREVLLECEQQDKHIVFRKHHTEITIAALRTTCRRSSYCVEVSFLFLPPKKHSGKNKS